MKTPASRMQTRLLAGQPAQRCLHGSGVSEMTARPPVANSLNHKLTWARKLPIFGQLARSFWPKTLPATSSQPSSVELDLFKDARARSQMWNVSKQRFGPEDSSSGKWCESLLLSTLRSICRPKQWTHWGRLHRCRRDHDLGSRTPGHVRSNVCLCRPRCSRRDMKLTCEHVGRCKSELGKQSG
jgi:hypothetical protein